MVDPFFVFLQILVIQQKVLFTAALSIELLKISLFLKLSKIELIHWEKMTAQIPSERLAGESWVFQLANSEQDNLIFFQCFHMLKLCFLHIQNLYVPIRFINYFSLLFSISVVDNLLHEFNYCLLRTSTTACKVYLVKWLSHCTVSLCQILHLRVTCVVSFLKLKKFVQLMYFWIDSQISYERFDHVSIRLSPLSFFVFDRNLFFGSCDATFSCTRNLGILAFHPDTWIENKIHATPSHRRAPPSWFW